MIIESKFEVITDGECFALKRTSRTWFGMVVEFLNFKPNVPDSTHWVTKDFHSYSNCWIKDKDRVDQFRARFEA